MLFKLKIIWLFVRDIKDENMIFPWAISSNMLFLCDCSSVKEKHHKNP